MSKKEDKMIEQNDPDRALVYSWLQVIVALAFYRMRRIAVVLLISLLILLAEGCQKEDIDTVCTYDKTVIVYMAADNSLSSYSKKNINQMESVMETSKN